MSNPFDNQIRRQAGSDARLPPSASCEAGSGLAGSPVRSGPATGEALIMPLEGGGEVRFTAVHGRVDMQIRVGKQRSWLTTPVSGSRARDYAERLTLISDLADAQRQAKGA